MGLKERLSLQILSESAQSVKIPVGQPESTSQRKSKCISQTEGPNTVGIKVMMVFVEQSSENESKSMGPGGSALGQLPSLAIL